jgi:para-aminobenzoate synthetase
LSAAVDWKAGWVGWLGYEMKDETLAGYSRQRAEQTEEEAKEKSRAVPDACFAYTDRVLAYEHATGSWVALGLVEISLMPASPDTRSGRPLLEELLTGADVRFASTQASWSSWLDTLRITLSRLQSSSSASALPTPSLPIPLPPFIPAHSGPTYSSKIDECRSAIREGESYELCLTTQFHSRPSSSALPSSFSSSSPTLSSFSPRNTSIPDSYSIYRRLRHSNPAPYASYINLPFIDVAVISSSPERFLKVSREGRVEMKPIKGTIGRCRGDPVEDERRKRGLENDKKEIAENLMVRFARL